MAKYMLLLCLGLCALVNGQGMGHGLSKYTRGQSHPRTCLAFFEKYTDGVEAPDDCRLGKCECATQGRCQVLTSRNSPFGIHSINCTYHPYGEHSLEDIENMQADELNDFKDGYNQHLDSHLGLWVSDLKDTMEKLENDNAIHYAMTWKEAGKSYYSVMTVPCSGYYIEFLSTKAGGIDSGKFHETKEVRYAFGNFTHPTRDYHPIKVSRATTKVDEMVSFYTDIIGGKLLSNVTVDGVNIAWVQLTDAPTLLLQFVNRPPSSSAKFSVGDLETYVNKVHDQYVKSTTCGFDQHADHHWAYDTSGRRGGTLSDAAKKLDKAGYKYRWFSVNPGEESAAGRSLLQGGGMTQMYAFDPSGWTIQLDWMPGDDVPRRLPTYSAACKSNDGCRGQGLCNKDDGLFTPF